MKNEKIRWNHWCIKNVDTGDFWLAHGWGNGLLTTAETFIENGPMCYDSHDSANNRVEILLKEHHDLTGKMLHLKVVEFEVREC